MRLAGGAAVLAAAALLAACQSTGETAEPSAQSAPAEAPDQKLATAEAPASAPEADQAQGLTAARLPEYMAVAVTERMLARGMATDREQARAHNICTRKLWEQLVQAENSPAGDPALAAGQ